MSARARLDALLGESPRWTAGKQRLTATQLWRLLRGEGIAIGETTVKTYVREWKRKRAEVFVPLVYRPGELAEVDFFEVLVDVAGRRQKEWMFLMRTTSSSARPCIAGETRGPSTSSSSTSTASRPTTSR